MIVNKNYTVVEDLRDGEGTSQRSDRNKHGDCPTETVNGEREYPRSGHRI